jgi:hypothetical protein
MFLMNALAWNTTPTLITEVVNPDKKLIRWIDRELRVMSNDCAYLKQNCAWSGQFARDFEHINQIFVEYR